MKKYKEVYLLIKRAELTPEAAQYAKNQERLLLHNIIKSRGGNPDVTNGIIALYRQNLWPSAYFSGYNGKIDLNAMAKYRTRHNKAILSRIQLPSGKVIKPNTPLYNLLLSWADRVSESNMERFKKDPNYASKPVDVRVKRKWWPFGKIVPKERSTRDRKHVPSVPKIFENKDDRSYLYGISPAFTSTKQTRNNYSDIG